MSRTGWWLILQTAADPAEVLAGLRQQPGLFPEAESWWFAWHATDIALPQALTDPAPLQAAWDVVRVFSPQAELRVQRRGRQRDTWLLLETDEPAALDLTRFQAWQPGEAQSYSVEDGHHLLAGQKLNLLGAEKRGELIYPRVLDYGVDEAEPGQTIVAEVRHYYDALHRLATTRYAALRPVTRGSLPVARFEAPESLF